MEDWHYWGLQNIVTNTLFKNFFKCWNSNIK